jgi:hypothetical protein
MTWFLQPSLPQTVAVHATPSSGQSFAVQQVPHVAL